MVTASPFGTQFSIFNPVQAQTKVILTTAIGLKV